MKKQYAQRKLNVSQLNGKSFKILDEFSFSTGAY